MPSTGFNFSALFSGRMLLFSLLAACLLMLSGCSNQELYSNLTEEHANEMVAVLREGNIESGKQTGEEGKWTVTVAQGDFAKAIDILRARGLPKEQFQSLGTLFPAGGITETPVAQRARLIFGLEQQLNKMISSIDGVVTAQVQLAMPEPDRLTQELKPSSASVLVKSRSGFDLQSQRGTIKSLVASGVQGLAYDNVTVAIVPAQTLPIAKPANDSISFGALAKILLGLIALGILYFAGRHFLRMRKTNRTEIVTDTL
jgi:type III secretion protein J